MFQFSGFSSSALVWPEPKVVWPTTGTSQPMAPRVLRMRERKPALTLHGMIACAPAACMRSSSGFRSGFAASMWLV